MLKNLYLTFHKNYFIKKLKLFIKSFGVGSFLNSEVKGTKEEYVKLYEEFSDKFGGVNTVLVMVENKNGTVYDKEFLKKYLD